MTKYRKERLWRPLVAKAYFDKGMGELSIVKYAVALFAIKIPSSKYAILAGVGYVIFCYIFGRWCYNHKVVEIEQEIGNMFNPFVREMREKYNNRKV